MRSPFQSALATTGWGLFCACSWTWCIGMFLPVIMLRRYGWTGFLVFAIPNVIGCAAFGYVLRNRSRSEALVARHGAAACWFSSLTIAFHMLFIGIVVLELWPSGSIPTCLAVLAVVYGAGLVLARLGDRAWLWLSAATWLLSVTIFAALLGGRNTLDQLAPTQPAAQLAWLAPVVAFGFLFCPYLDLTFHRALQRSPSRHAFFIFGVGFAVMIVMTCFLWFRPTPILTGLALGHLAAQTVFTVGAHRRELREHPRATSTTAVVHHLVPWLAGLGFIGAKLVAGDAAIGTGAYLRMLVAWGLLFPVYVWLFIGPGRSLPTSRRALLGFALAITASLPFYEAGFIHHATWLLAVPMVGFGVWRLLLIVSPGAGRTPDVAVGGRS